MIYLIFFNLLHFILTMWLFACVKTQDERIEYLMNEKEKNNFN